MATLYISEFKGMAISELGHQVSAPMSPPVTEQKVAIAGVSAQSSALSSNTRYVMVHTDAICSLAFGSDPTAVTTAHRMGANETRFYGVVPGSKIAVISNT